MQISKSEYIGGLRVYYLFLTVDLGDSKCTRLMNLSLKCTKISSGGACPRTPLEVPISTHKNNAENTLGYMMIYEK